MIPQNILDYIICDDSDSNLLGQLTGIYTFCLKSPIHVFINISKDCQKA